MSKKPEKDQEVNILDGINLDSVKKSLDAGIILPPLKPELDKVYEFNVNSMLRTFKSEYSDKTLSMDIIYDGMSMSIVIPDSFKFQLVVEMFRHKLVDDSELPDFSQLIGKTLILRKTIGNTKKYKDVPLYSVQIKN